MAAVTLPHIRNITISGRIGTGASTLAEKIAEVLGWKLLNGGQLFRELSEELGISITDSEKRPDHFDIAYEERIKKMLKTEKNHIVQSHLAGFDSQGIPQVYKVLTLCIDKDGNDKTDIRIDRLVNRDGHTIEQVKYEVKERERQHLEKFRRLYMHNDQNWVYWDKKYYDLVINTYAYNSEASLTCVLQAIGYNPNNKCQ
jgi:cytidylate kinase